jgi:hypothetical protein
MDYSKITEDLFIGTTPTVALPKSEEVKPRTITIKAK